MSDQQTCPHCGVEKHFVYPDFFYKCNTPVRESKRRTYKCYERQLAAKDAEIERLRDTLNKINDLLPQHDDEDGNLFNAYIDSDGDVAFEPVNVDSLMTEMAVIIAEARAKVK